MSLSLSTICCAQAGELVIGEGVPVNPGVFGANNNNATPDNRPGQPEYAALIKALGVRHLRYIGGSSSSFWDWETGHYIPEDEITSIWAADHGNWMLELAAPTAELPAGTLGPDNYANFAEQAGVDVQWLVNLTTRHQDQAGFVRHLKANDLPLDFIEMDNETYFWSKEFSGPQGAQLYADRVKELTQVVREHYPEARIGIVAWEESFFEEHGHQGSPTQNNWDSIITSADNRPYFDAFILHHYLMNTSRLDAYDNQVDRSKAFLAYPQSTLERAGRIIAEAYGPIPMWITEYNVIGYYRIGNPNDEKPDNDLTDGDKWIASTAHTGWNALYQAGFWLTGLCHPESIEILNHHSVSNIELGWGLGVHVSMTEGDISATGQLFAHLSHLAMQHDKMHAVQVKGNELLGVTIEADPGMGALHAAALSSDDRLTLIVINRSDQPVEASLPHDSRFTSADITTYLATETIEKTARVKYDAEAPVWAQGPMHPDKQQAALDASGLLKKTLPGYSLTVIELKP